MAYSTVDDNYDAFGLAGGILLALTVAPQISRALIRDNVADIMLSWEVASIVGDTLLLVSYVYSDLQAVVLPLCMEMLLIMVLIGVKLYFELTPHGKRRVTMAALRKLRRDLIKDDESTADQKEPQPVDDTRDDVLERGLESDAFEERYGLEESHVLEEPDSFDEKHE